jgi:2-amino-4-hydroxy-6-hydroxymethyldihydropteridine diphosphokinase
VSAVVAYVGLGSNLGDRDVHLEFAVLALADLEGVEPTVCSPVYETDPMGPGEQRPYLNAVLEVQTGLPAAVLLDAMLDIEERAGRSRRPDVPRWSSRTLDLDLLLYGDHQINEPNLKVPHPGLAERAFTLVPLVDLVPNLVHPELGETVSAILANVSRAGVRPWERCLRIPG